MQSAGKGPWLALCIGVGVVSTAALLIRWALQEGASALEIAAARLCLAALAVWPIALWTHGQGAIAQLLRTADPTLLRWTLVAGLSLAAHFALWISSLDHTSVASSVALVTTNPIWVALAAWLWLGERPGRKLWIAIGLSMLGSLLISWKDLQAQASDSELWGNLLFPLRYERNNVKSGLKYESDGARGEAMHSYLIVLEELLYRLNMHATARVLTPRQLCKERNDSGRGAHIPNAGTHWSDWVPQHIKLRVCVLFDAIPYKQRAKRKLPFQRAIPPLLYSRLYAALGLRTQGFLSAAQRKHAVAPTEETAATVAAIQQALAVLKEWPRNTALPYAWQSLAASTASSV
ncbi:MAG: DMT family transporter [Betaproteobacteria bacterium]|nr:DMT family transporter [Betaproteobacteria bacterium]